MMTTARLFVAALGLAAAGAQAAVAEGTMVAGVELPGAIEVEAHRLVLNGAALRKVAFIKIYVAGLYLENKESQPETILNTDGARTLMMHFLRDVDAAKLCEGWDNSLSQNTPNPSDALKAQFQTLCSWMVDAEQGERLKFVYSPGQGTSVEYAGKVKGPMPGKEFADALFRTWLGPKSIPGEEFKKHLLGG